MNVPMVIGLGSDHGDDQAGWLVIHHLQARGYPMQRLRCVRHPSDLLDTSGQFDRLIVCDASLATNSLGRIYRFKWPDERLTYQRARGSHDLTLQEILELGATLQIIPPSTQVWAIDGSISEPCAAPSAAVATAAAEVARKIWEDCRHA